jgi:hypothetical protein
MTGLHPDEICELEERADQADPDALVATARQALALIGRERDVDGQAVALAIDLAGAETKLGDVRALAQEWAASRDLGLAAAGRVLTALLDGRVAVQDLIAGEPT